MSRAITFKSQQRMAILNLHLSKIWEQLCSSCFKANLRRVCTLVRLISLLAIVHKEQDPCHLWRVWNSYWEKHDVWLPSGANQSSPPTPITGSWQNLYIPLALGRMGWVIPRSPLLCILGCHQSFLIILYNTFFY